MQTYHIKLSRTDREFSCAADTTVLEGAKIAGFRLPSSCCQGMCSTCKSKLVSGTVDMNANGGIMQREIDKGMILLCCSKPTSDLVIEK